MFVTFLHLEISFFLKLMKIIFDISMKLPKLIEKRTKFPKHKFQQWSAEFLEGKGEAKSWLRMAKWWRKSELQPLCCTGFEEKM